MLYEVDGPRFDSLGHLFGNWNEAIAARSVLNENTRAKVYVDDMDKASLCFIWTQSGRCYLTGNPRGLGLEGELEDLLLSTLSLDGLATGHPHVVIQVPDDEGDWGDLLQDMIPHRRLKQITMSTYLFDPDINLEYGKWRRLVSQGYAIRQVDTNMMAKEVDKYLVNHVLDTWSSVSAFIASGVGFAMTRGNEIISTCLSSHVSGGDMLTDVRTYRSEDLRRGYGSLVVRAFLDHCMDRNLRPGWQVMDYMDVALRMAERFALRKVSTRSVYHLAYEERMDMLFHGIFVLESGGDKNEALSLVRSSMDIGDPTVEDLYRVGRSLATHGHQDDADVFLRMAGDAGLDVTSRMAMDPRMVNW